MTYAYSLLLASLTLVACGPEAGKFTSDATSETATTSTGSTGSGTTEATTATTDPTTAGEACAIFWDNQDIGPEVEITVVNNTMQTIWFRPAGGCSQAPGISVTQDGEVTPLQTQTDGCWPSLCSDFMTSDDCVVGCPDCAGPSAGRIAPGGEMTTTWRGNLYRPMMMNESCSVGGEACVQACVRQEQAPDAGYTLGLTAFTMCEGACDCDGAALEECYIYDVPTLSGEFVAEGTLDFPSQTAATIVLE